MYPSDRKYSKEHEWVLVEGDACVVGITHFAQDELGELVFVELPSVGDQFDAGDEIGTIESVKAVAEIYTPVGGEILEINEAAVDEPALLNEDPHEEGWLVKIRMADAAELDELMDSEAYDAFVRAG